MCISCVECHDAANRICEGFNWPSSIVTSGVTPKQSGLGTDVSNDYDVP